MQRVFFFIVLICFTQISFSQNNIGIGTITPNPKSLLDLTSNDKGLLVPRLTTAQRLNINPVGFADAALLVYDIDDSLFYFWNSAQWVAFPKPNTGSNNISLTFDATTGTLSLTDDGGTLTANFPIDNDTDPTNEIQQLSLSGNTLNLSISNNNIDLSPYLDNTDNQTLTLNNNTLAISNGNSVDLSSFLDNTDNQTLSWNGNTLSISNGNSVTIDINDADSDPTNELNTAFTFNASNNILSITDAGGTFSVDLSSLTDNNWSITGNAGTNPNNNFIGTTDAQSFVIRTDNTERINILPNGNVGIGTSNPTTELDVNGTVRANELVGPFDQSANGYIRIGDMQIAWGTAAITVAGWNYNGNGIHYQNTITTINFPASFIAPPVLSITNRDSQPDTRACYVTNFNSNTTHFTVDWISSPTSYGINPTPTGFTIHWMAMGRWR